MGIIKDWIYKRSLKNRLIEVFDKSGLYIEHQTRGEIYYISSNP